MEPKAITMVEYYRAQGFNPVLIPVERQEIWKEHVAKRRVLYERHLGLPLSLLRGRQVLEFGCNSGENALVLATHGARLTFVEPNPLVAPRLRELFQSFGLEASIDAFHEAGIADFQSEDRFDLVIAEGFLSTLRDRDAMLAKIVSLVKPGGFGVVSFNDRPGGLLEMLKRAVLYRAYALASVTEVQSAEALAIASTLFEADFLKLKASRPFETWWRDTLVAPVYLYDHLWSYPEMLAILQAHGAVAFGTSPMWSSWEHFNWYKNTSEADSINGRFEEDWRHHLFYFLTGAPPTFQEGRCPDVVLEEVEGLVKSLALIGDTLDRNVPAPLEAPLLFDHLMATPTEAPRAFARELKAMFGALGDDSGERLRAVYRTSTMLRSQWGTAYHYLCFQKSTA